MSHGAHEPIGRHRGRDRVGVLLIILPTDDDHRDTLGHAVCKLGVVGPPLRRPHAAGRERDERTGYAVIAQKIVYRGFLRGTWIEPRAKPFGPRLRARLAGKGETPQ